MSNEMKLNVSSNVKRIQVNDAGEYITLNLDDQSLIPRLLELMKDFEAASKEHTSRAAEIDAMAEDADDDRMAKVAAEAEFNLEICTTLKQKVDDAFGDEVCRKVFGDIVPGVSAFAEFFDQLGSLMKQFGAERTAEAQKRIAKYTDKYKKE